MNATLGNVRNGGEGGGGYDEQRDRESDGKPHAGSVGRLSRRVTVMPWCTNLRFKLGVVETSLLAGSPWF